MRIISKFKDYYDIGLQFGVDPKLVYVREMHEMPEDLIKELSQDPSLGFIFKPRSGYSLESTGKKWPMRFDLSTVYVIFCGRLYMGLTNAESRMFDLPGADFLWSMEAIEKYVRTHGSKKTIEKWERKSVRRDLWGYGSGLHRDVLEKKFARVAEVNERMKNDLVAIHLTVNSPVICVGSAWDYSRRYPTWKSSAWIDAQLKDVKFASVVDPYTAFQELSMFMSNYIGVGEPQTVEIADEYKIAEHGYNELSFRHPTKIRKQ